MASLVASRGVALQRLRRPNPALSSREALEPLDRGLRGKRGSLLVARTACGIVFAALCLAVGAQDEPPSQPVRALALPRWPSTVTDPVLDALIAEVLRRNPAQERALPDPLISVALAEAADPWAATQAARDMTTPALMWSQELRAQLGLHAATARAYYGLLLARDQRALAAEQRESWNEIEAASRARYVVGHGSQQDVLRAQVELTRAEELWARHDAEAEVRQAEINRLRLRPIETEVATPSRLTLDALEEPADAVWERVRGASPEIWAVQIAIQQARLATRLVPPAPTTALTKTPPAVPQAMPPAGASMSLPLLGKGGAAYYEARLRATERRAEDLEMQLRYRTHERHTQLAMLQRVARLYDRGIIPQDRLVLQATLANYAAGKVAFTAVLEALRTLMDDRSAYLGVLHDHAVMRTRLEEARLDSGTGMAPMPAGQGGHRRRPGASGAGLPMGGE